MSQFEWISGLEYFSFWEKIVTKFSRATVWLKKKNGWII
jgi:hypothetical protein